VSFQEEVKSKSSPEEQMVGRCFLQHSETMKSVYTEYCINHDKAEQLLEKYDQVQVDVLADVLDLWEDSILYLNINSALKS